jgi:hypothetical protein
MLPACKGGEHFLLRLSIKMPPLAPALLAATDALILIESYQV